MNSPLKNAMDKEIERLVRDLVVQHNPLVKSLMRDEVEVCILQILKEWPERECIAKNFAEYFVLSLNVINKRLNRMEEKGYVQSKPGAGTLRFRSLRDPE